MALSGDPSAQSIASEFGSFTRNMVNGSSNVGLYKLKEMYQHVIGGTVHSRTEFGGKARATVVADSMSVSINNDMVTVSANLTTGGLTTTLVVEYQSALDGNGNAIAEPDDNEWQELGRNSGITSDGVRSSVSSIADGTYFFRASIFNAFISHEDDWAHANSGNNTDRWTVNTAPAVFDPPTIITAYDFFNSVRAEWNYGDSPSSFSAEIRIDGGAWEAGSLQSSSNWGSATNPKIGTWNPASVPNLGDLIEIRIRANAEGGTGQSDWSNIASFNF